MVEIGILLAVEFDVFKSIRNNRQVTQSQEVHLEKPQTFTGRVVELGDDRPVLRTFHDGDDVRQRVR